MNSVINSLMQKRKPPKGSVCPKHNTLLVKPAATNRGSAYKPEKPEARMLRLLEGRREREGQEIAPHNDSPRA